MPDSAIQAPPALASLPTDSRGFIVPAEAPWNATAPLIKDLDPQRQMLLAARHACTVCGLPIDVGSHVARVFTQGEAAHRRMYNREYTIEDGGPGHVGCMLYAAQVCPFLSSPTARLGKNSLTAPGQKRGTRAAVLVYQDYLLALAEHGDGSPGTVRTVYRDLVDDVPYHLPEELSALYEQTLASELIDLAAPRSYWRDTNTDRDEIRQLVEKTLRSLPEPEFSLPAYGREYFVFPLPILRRPSHAHPAKEPRTGNDLT